MRYMRILVTTTLIFLLAGCALTKSPTVSEATPDPSQAKLAEAATSISKSLTNLAQIEQAAMPPSPNYRPPNPAEYGMSNLVSIDWSGPVLPLIEQMAKSTGYQVRVLGRPPAIPAMVSISARNQQIGDILRDIGFQVSKKADVVVFPSNRIIELRYAQT